MMDKAVGFLTILAVGGLLVACETVKSANPLSPSVAGPIPGVVISEPKLLEPGQGQEIDSAASQPVRLLIENASTSGVRPLRYRVEIASDQAFTSTVFVAEAISPGSEGRTLVQIPSSLPSDRTYFWRARATDGEARSNWAATESFRTPLPTAPAPGPSPRRARARRASSSTRSLWQPTRRSPPSWRCTRFPNRAARRGSTRRWASATPRWRTGASGRYRPGREARRGPGPPPSPSGPRRRRRFRLPRRRRARVPVPDLATAGRRIRARRSASSSASAASTGTCRRARSCLSCAPSRPTSTARAPAAGRMRGPGRGPAAVRRAERRRWRTDSGLERPPVALHAARLRVLAEKGSGVFSPAGARKRLPTPLLALGPGVP